MTNMELLELFGETRMNYVQEAQKFRSGNNTLAKNHHSVRKLWILAAAIIAVLALSLTAYAALNARIQMQLTQAQETKPEERAALCSIYPQTTPEGYRLISGSTNSANVRELYYWNDSGTEISFCVSMEQDLREIPLNPSGEKTESTVSGHAAILYQMDSTRWILWQNTEAGYTAYLRTDDSGVDLLAMAESVCVGEEQPESFGKGTADETSGMWYPQWVPDGYRIHDVTPVSEGIQSVEYARFEDSGDILLIQYVISFTRDLSNIGHAPHSTMVWEDVDIAGTPGRMVTIGDHQKLLFWKNETEGFNAMLMTEETDEDLAAIAASVGPGAMLEVSPVYTQKPAFSVQMEQEDTYVEFEPWYPQALPDGYEISFVSDKMYGEQAIRYENAQGDAITYVLYYRLGSWPRGYEGDLEPEQVDINGMTGYLLENENMQMLLWVNEEKGFGFSLKTGTDADILTIARSVAPGEELPASNADKTETALNQLGDYRVTALPEGMQEDGVAGWPKENTNDWYSYIRRRYICPENNHQVAMEYATYVLQDSTIQEIACAMAGINSKSVQIGGLVGACSESEGRNTLVWIDESAGLSFELSSGDYSIAELIAMAQSVQRIN